MHKWWSRKKAISLKKWWSCGTTTQKSTFEEKKSVTTPHLSILPFSNTHLSLSHPNLPADVSSEFEPLVCYSKKKVRKSEETSEWITEARMRSHDLTSTRTKSSAVLSPLWVDAFESVGPLPVAVDWSCSSALKSVEIWCLIQTSLAPSVLSVTGAGVVGGAYIEQGSCSQVDDEHTYRWRRVRLAKNRDSFF